MSAVSFIAAVSCTLNSSDSALRKRPSDLQDEDVLAEDEDIGVFAMVDLVLFVVDNELSLRVSVK